MTEERAPYFMNEQAPPPHIHQFGFAFGGKIAIRYCEMCGKSWTLSEMRDLISTRTVPCWNEILESDQARDTLDEEAQKYAPKR